MIHVSRFIYFVSKIKECARIACIAFLYHFRGKIVRVSNSKIFVSYIISNIK